MLSRRREGLDIQHRDKLVKRRKKNIKLQEEEQSRTPLLQAKVYEFDLWHIYQSEDSSWATHSQ